MGDSPSYYYLAESAHAAQIFPRRPRSRPRPRLGVWARLRGRGRRRGRFGCGCAASCKEVPPDAFETQWVNDEARWSGLKFTSDERGRGAHGLTSRVALQRSAANGLLTATVDEPLRDDFQRLTRARVFQRNLRGPRPAQPGKYADTSGAQKLCQHSRICAAGKVMPRRRHEHELGLARRGGRQGRDDQPRLVERAEPVWADNEGNGAQRDDQVPRIEVFTERTEQPAGAFDQDNVEISSDLPHVAEHLGGLEPPSFLPGRQAGSERRAETPGIDLFKWHRAIQRRLEDPGVVSPAGTDRFEGRHREVALA